MSSAGNAVDRYASAPWALALCDRCGFTYKLSQLHEEIYDQRLNGLKVCRACLDVDHPQLRLGLVRVNDPQSLRDPRPDVGEQSSTSYFGWLPVGNPLTNVQTRLGNVTVTIS